MKQIPKTLRILTYFYIIVVGLSIIGCAKQSDDECKLVFGTLMNASELTEYIQTRNQEPSFHGGQELSEEEAREGLECFRATKIDKKDYGATTCPIIAGIILQVHGKEPILLEYDSGGTVWDASNFGKKSFPRLKGKALEEWFAQICNNYFVS